MTASKTLPSKIIQVPCSVEQEEAIADHLLSGEELGIVEGERARIARAVNKLYPGAKVLSANLIIEDVFWEVQIQL